MPTHRAHSPEKIPRPPNAFICYRSARASAHAAGSAGVRQHELSKRVGAEWRALDPAARAHFARVAAEKKEEHASRFPGYKYRPQRRAAAVGPAASASAGTGTRAQAGPPSDVDVPPHAATPTPTTWYVPVAAGTFARLVNAPHPPAHTASPAQLRAPHLLAYGSLRELADAAALALAPPAGARGEGLYVPVPVRGAGGGRVYASMHALCAGEAVEGAPEAYLRPVLGGLEGGGSGGEEGAGARELRWLEGEGPFLDEETRWPPAVYPGTDGWA